MTHPRAGMLSEMEERWLNWEDLLFFSLKSWISQILSEVGFSNSGKTESSGFLDLAATTR